MRNHWGRQSQHLGDVEGVAECIEQNIKISTIGRRQSLAVLSLQTGSHRGAEQHRPRGDYVAARSSWQSPTRHKTQQVQKASTDMDYS
jgi:hypothetical protein